MRNKKALDRRISIYNRLLRGEVVNVGDLAEYYGVSIRTIQYDMKNLCEMYDDIESSRNGNYKISKKHFVYEDIDVYKMFFDFLLKKDKDSLFISDIDLEEIEDLEKFKSLINISKLNYSLKITYENKEFIIHPLKIANFKNRWYLIGYDLNEKEIKVIHINSIQKLRNALSNYLDDEEKEKKLKEEIEKNFKNLFSEITFRNENI